MKLKKRCVVCGKKLNILVNKDKTYAGGHYYGEPFVREGKKAEYWECEKCNSEED